MTCRNCSGVSRVAGTAVPIPALLTSTSTRPNSAIAGLDQRRARLGSATSVADRQRPAAGARTQCGGLLEPLHAPRAERDVGAGLGECLGERDAQPAGGAGDDGDLAVEAEQVGDRHGRQASGRF